MGRVRTASAELKAIHRSAKGFESRFRAKEATLPNHHPLSRRLNGGQLQPFQIRAWVANHFYYQACIPIKSATDLTNHPDPSNRHRRTARLLDNVGSSDQNHGGPGGIDVWLRLGEAVGLTPDQLWSHKYVVPGVRFAVQAYVNFLRHASLQEVAISSLADILWPEGHGDSLSEWSHLYPWIEPEGLAYFCNCIQSNRCDFGRVLQIAQQWCMSRERLARAMNIVQFKIDILWTMLDAIQRAYPDDMATGLHP